MAKPRLPKPVFFFASILYRIDLHGEESLIDIFKQKIDDEVLIFKHPYFPMKEYYSHEMGGQELLGRFFIFSLQKNDRTRLVELKHWADSIEKSFTKNECRSVNFDIGYVAEEQMGLATFKGFAHRTYLGNHVFFDLTYVNESAGFKILPWSYPDYSHPQVIEFFNFIQSNLTL